MSRNKNEVLGKEHRLGLGGGPIGTAFVNMSDSQAQKILETAWEEGIRYFDTSPWYGLTKSERRFGEFLKTKNREDFILSTKVGRIFTKVPEKEVPPTMWKNPLNYDYRHDYTADGTKRSIEESLERTGLDRIDIVYIHDLSEDQVGDRYEYYMKQAREGAFKVLSDLRSQGVIKGWGMGVNQMQPILDCMEYADPNICLAATQYSILQHDEASAKLLPKVKKNGVKLACGAGFNSGYLAGRKRFNYKEDIPLGMDEKFKTLKDTCKKYGTDPLTAAIHFVLAADEFAAIIPGAGTADQVKENVKSLSADISPEFWKELREKGIIYEEAQTPE